MNINLNAPMLSMRLPCAFGVWVVVVFLFLFFFLENSERKQKPECGGGGVVGDTTAPVFVLKAPSRASQ